MAQRQREQLRAVVQAAAPLGVWWLDAATAYGMSIAVIAAVYIGFAVTDGRPAAIAVETTVAGAFVVLAAAGVTRSARLIVVGLVGQTTVELILPGCGFSAKPRVNHGLILNQHASRPWPGLMLPGLDWDQ